MFVHVCLYTKKLPVASRKHSSAPGTVLKFYHAMVLGDPPSLSVNESQASHTPHVASGCSLESGGRPQPTVHTVALLTSRQVTSLCTGAGPVITPMCTGAGPGHQTAVYGGRPHAPGSNSARLPSSMCARPRSPASRLGSGTMTTCGMQRRRGHVRTSRSMQGKLPC